jgi:hypothetical protein
MWGNLRGKELFEASLHSNPSKFFDHLEAWWGADFDDELIQRMAKAPKKHKNAFADSLMPFCLNPGLVSIPDIPPGALRPVMPTEEFLPRNIRRRDSLRLLLYAQEVLLDGRDLFGDFVIGVHDEDTFEGSLRHLRKMRPFIEDGSIKFSNPMIPDTDSAVLAELYRAIEQPHIAAIFDEMLTDLSVEFEDWPGFGQGSVLRDFVWLQYGGVATACHLAKEHQANILARGKLQEMIIDALLQRPTADGRHVVLKKLAAMKVPTMTSDLDTLVALRKSDADFAEWRTRLGDAMAYVEELHEGAASLDEAAEVVFAQLSDGLSHVQKAVKKSPALQAVKGGVTGLALTGVSTVATAMTSGDPAKAAFVGGATKLADAGLTYVKALRARRKGHLILDVAILFNPSSPVDN